MPDLLHTFDDDLPWIESERELHHSSRHCGIDLRHAGEPDGLRHISTFVDELLFDWMTKLERRARAAK